jgi:hypothetical protein
VSVLERYHALLRAIIRPAPEKDYPAPSLGDPMTYRALVRLQHHQPLAQVFEDVRRSLGGPRFDALVDTFRLASPPTHPQPACWTRPFADYLAEQPDVPLPIIERADYLALRTEQAMAPDLLLHTPGSAGELRAYAHDPRSEIRSDASPVNVLVVRDQHDVVRAFALDLVTVAAWGLAHRQTDRAALSRAGLTDEALKQARESLVRMGVALPADDQTAT